MKRRHRVLVLTPSPTKETGLVASHSNQAVPCPWKPKSVTVTTKDPSSTASFNQAEVKHITYTY
jgi:hypothetical protein